MADGADSRILIDVRVRKDQAEKDLAALKKEAAATTREINAIDKKIATLQGNTKLADNLRSAQAAAKATADEIDKIGTALDDAVAKRAAEIQATTGFKNISPGTINSMAVGDVTRANPELIAQQETLITQFNKESAAVEKANAAFQAQEAQLSQLSQLNQTRDNLVAKGKTIEDGLSQESGAAQIAASQLLRAQVATKAFGDATNAVLAPVKALARVGAAAFSKLATGAQQFVKQLTGGSKLLNYFLRRLKRLVWGAVVFNGVSKALRIMSSYMSSALAQSNQFTQAMANLKGAAATAAAPLIQLIAPALTAIANAAAVAFSYIAKLVSLLTGKTISSMRGTAAAIGATADATKEASSAAKGALAPFDELNTLQQNQSGGGAGTITPNYDFTGSSPFLDDMLAAIQAGDWFQVGALVAEKINDAMANIPWANIQATEHAIALNIATTLNGFVATLDWPLLGYTIGMGINTALDFVNTLFQTFDWVTLGMNLGLGLISMMATIDWETAGQVLTDKFMALLDTLHGFLLTVGPEEFAQFGTDLGAMLVSAVGNIDWVQAAGDVTNLIIGLLTMLNSALEQVDWDAVGQTLLDMLSTIDWAGLLTQVGQLIANLLPVILPALLIGGIQAALGVLFVVVQALLVAKLITLFAAGGVALLGAIAGWAVVIAAGLALLFGLLLTHWGTVSTWLQETFGPLLTKIGDFFGTIGELFLTLWDGVIYPVIEFWASIIGPFILSMISGIATGIGNFIGFFTDQIALATTILQGIIDFMIAVFAGDWDKAWAVVQDTVQSVWDQISAIIKGCVNNIIGFVNSMISSIVNGLNAVFDAINSINFTVPDWIPGFGGKSFKPNLGKLTAPQIPLLAKGAVIPPNSQFLAMLGDQKSGTNIEAPLDTIKQAFIEAMATQNGSRQSGDIYLQVDGKTFARIMKPFMDQENKRVGTRIITGGVY